MNTNTVNTASTNDFMTTAEISELLGISRSTTLRLLRKHQVKVIRLGKNFRVPLSEVDRLEASLYETLGTPEAL